MVSGWRDYDKTDTVPFEELKGKTIARIYDAEVGKEQMTILCTDGTKYTLTYYDDCCASCSIEDICGDINDLIGSEILMAELVESGEPHESVIAERKAKYEKDKAEAEAEGREHWEWGPTPSNGWKDESETWSFYKLATIKGSVTIRWYGSSNGYYSETCTFEKWKRA